MCSSYLVELLVFCLIGVINASLIVNLKNKGEEILRESIQSDISNDTIELEFQKSDGTLITQFIDFKNEIQIMRTIVLGEEELGQTEPQTMCFITRFVKSEFITSDAMSKLRQKNPSAIRSPEEDKGMEMITLDSLLNVNRGYMFSPYIQKMCEEAKTSTYTRESDIKVISRTLSKDYNMLSGACKKTPLDKVPSCSMVVAMQATCLCRYEICVGWYPCGLKYCHGKDSTGKTVSYRCGIKTCKKCRLYDYHVNRKSDCLWDQND